MRISDWSSDVCSSDLSPSASTSVEKSAMPSAILLMMEHSLALRSAYLRPSLSEARLISENRPWKWLWKDSSSVYLKPCCRVFSSSSLWVLARWTMWRSEEHTSELQSLMRISYAVFCLKKKNDKFTNQLVLITH